MDKGWGFESQLCFEQKESRKGSVLLVLALDPCFAVDSRDVMRSSVSSARAPEHPSLGARSEPLPRT